MNVKVVNKGKWGKRKGEREDVRGAVRQREGRGRRRERVGEHRRGMFTSRKYYLTGNCQVHVDGFTGVFFRRHTWCLLNVHQFLKQF